MEPLKPENVAHTCDKNFRNPNDPRGKEPIGIWSVGMNFGPNLGGRQLQVEATSGPKMPPSSFLNSGLEFFPIFPILL